jgi:site-specific recombinase XerD
VATKALRLSSASNSQLFVSHVKPHQPVQPVTVARWLLEVMHLAGIDITCYKAHSARGAAAAHALKSGMPLSKVLSRGHWKQRSTFEKYYLREVDLH